MRDRLQADHLAALEGIAQGLDVRDGDARRAERPEQPGFGLFHAAELGRIHGVDRVLPIPADVDIAGDRVLSPYREGGALPRRRHIHDKPGRIEAVVLTGLCLELALCPHVCQRGADGVAGRVVQMVVRVLGQRPPIAGQKGQSLSFILDCHLFQRVSGHVQQGDAPVLGLAGGDELLSVDGNELNDTLDYDFYTDSKSFHLKARVADGIREWDVRREERGPFGCDFSTYLGDQKHSCSNHCMFCFIDQLPPGMRESLYFKDDDERLSFLFGNYITMTNMQDHEIERIIKMHISPINISVHTTNPQLRVRMLANKRGGEVLKYLPRLVQGGIAVNCQLVLCRGINDGDELRRTLTDLLELTPMVQSVAAVPCGVTDYRQNLFKQIPYDAETSAAVIDILEEFGDECKRRHGKRIIYPSDEWYLKAGRPIPDPEFYEDYDQLENGVGMMSLFRQEFLAELDKPHRIYGTKKLDVVTGTMAAPLIIEMMEELHRQYPMIEVTVHPIRNKFFGGNVGVAGLVTATDIIAQCEGKLTSGTLGVPAVMLREEKDTFLDDVTITQLGERLGVKVEVLPVGGGDEARALLRSGLHIARRKR